MAVSTNEKNAKFTSKGVVYGSRDPLVEFCNPFNILRVVEARNFKLGTVTDGSEF